MYIARWTLKDRRTATRTDARVGLSSHLSETIISSSSFCVLCWEQKMRETSVSHLSCSVQSFDRTSLHSPTQGAGGTSLPSFSLFPSVLFFSPFLLYFLSLSFSIFSLFLWLNFIGANVRPISKHLEFYLHLPTHCDGNMKLINLSLFSD